MGWEDPLKNGMALPLQHSCLGNLMDRGAQQATWAHKGWTQLSDYTTTTTTKLSDHNQNKYILHYDLNALTQLFFYTSITLKYKFHETNLTHIMCVMAYMLVCLQNSYIETLTLSRMVTGGMAIGR